MYDFEESGISLNYTATNYGQFRLPILENDFRSEYSLHHTQSTILKLTKNFSAKGWSTFIGVRNFTNFHSSEIIQLYELLTHSTNK